MNAPRLELQPAHALTLGELAALFNAAFTGYVGGDVHFTPVALARFLASTNADLDLSQVFLRDAQPVGFSYVARQGWTSRLAAFGVVPTATRQGIGRAAMTQLIALARVRGDRCYELEVIESNTPAVRLYEGLGFTRVRRLVSYKGQPPPPADPAASADALALEELDVYAVARLIVQHGAPDLPWQLSGTALARCGPPDVAFTLDGAYAVISNPAAETMTLRALLVPQELRRQGRATRLLTALFARYPGKTWALPALYPEAIGAGLAARFGFQRQPITQFQMRLPL